VKDLARRDLEEGLLGEREPVVDFRDQRSVPACSPSRKSRRRGPQSWSVDCWVSYPSTSEPGQGGPPHAEAQESCARGSERLPLGRVARSARDHVRTRTLCTRTRSLAANSLPRACGPAIGRHVACERSRMSNGARYA
jgi:hypothetical protein